MTRQSRMLIVVGLLAVMGVTGLAMLADRYRRIAPRVATDGNKVRVRTSESGVPEILARRVADFIDVRSAVKSVVDERMPLAERIIEESTGRIRDDLPETLVERYREMLAEIRQSKSGALGRLGIHEGDYERVRDAFREWMAAGTHADATLGAAFEIRAEELRTLHMGRLEPLDVGLASPSPGKRGQDPVY